MNMTTLFIVAIAAQVLLLSLDLAYRHRLAATQTNAEVGTTALVSLSNRIDVRSLGMLLFFILLYWGIQVGGMSLAPGADEVLESTRRSYAQWSGRSQAASSTSNALYVLLGVLTFYVAGLWDYLFHRFISHHRWFFFTHEYHHVPKEVFLGVPGIAGRPYAVIATFPTIVLTTLSMYALLALVRAPALDLRPLSALLIVWMMIGAMTHSEFLRQFPVIHRVLRPFAITTPQEHVLHHVVRLRCNYGNFTTLWDRVFGSYVDPTHLDLRSLALGLSYDQDFLGAITAGRWKLPKAFRKKYRIGCYCNLVENSDVERQETQETQGTQETSGERETGLTTVH